MRKAKYRVALGGAWLPLFISMVPTTKLPLCMFKLKPIDFHYRLQCVDVWCAAIMEYIGLAVRLREKMMCIG